MSTLDTRDGAPVGFSEKLASRPRRFVTRAASEPSRTARLSRTVVYILYGGCDNDIWGPLSTRSHVLRLESGESGEMSEIIAHASISQLHMLVHLRETKPMRINVRRVSSRTVPIASLPRFFLSKVLHKYV